jgi:hypothetical protein
METALIVVWILSPFAGFMIASHRRAGAMGFLLGAMFGPFGPIIAGMLDNRVTCSRCGTRWNENPTMCPGCHGQIEWNKKKTQHKVT